MSAAVRAGLSLSPTWLRGDLWRDDPQRSAGFAAGRDALEVALRAERAGWDFLLKPDVAQLQVERASTSPAFLSPDPLVLLSAIAGVTSTIELFPTVSTVFTAPFAIARALRSLDMLSAGRAGWNAVWSLGGHENFGISPLAHQHRFPQADAAVATVHALWAGFREEAVRADAGGEWVDPHQVTGVGGLGPLTLPGRARLPMLTAGGSPELLNFAAKWADGIFAAASEASKVQQLAMQLVEGAQQHGRNQPCGVLPGVILAVSASDEVRLPPADGAGDKHFVASGTPHDVVGKLAQFITDSGAPGFIALPYGGCASLDLVIDEVLPRLRQEIS